MARVIVFVAALGETIARTSPSTAVRWGDAADRDSVWAGGLGTPGLHWAFANGARFVVAEKDGRIVGHNLYLTTDRVRHDWLSIKLRTGRDVFSVAGFVLPEYRGQRLLASMKGFAARHFFAEGYRRNVSAVEADNKASIRAHDHVGAVPYATLRRDRVGDLILVWQGLSLRHIGFGARPYILSL